MQATRANMATMAVAGPMSARAPSRVAFSASQSLRPVPFAKSMSSKAMKAARVDCSRRIVVVRAADDKVGHRAGLSRSCSPGSGRGSSKTFI